MNAAYWASQKSGDPHGPDKYAELQPESYPMLEAIEKLALNDPLMLDLGCNVGRHMKALMARGYTHVKGMDARDDGQEYVGTFEEWLPQQADGAFDIIFTHGMTVELVPTTFPICAQLARLASHAIVLCIQETGIPYPRDWKAEFENEGMTLTRYDKPIVPDSNASLFVFEKIP